MATRDSQFEIEERNWSQTSEFINDDFAHFDCQLWTRADLPWILVEIFEQPQIRLMPVEIIVIAECLDAHIARGRNIYGAVCSLEMLRDENGTDYHRVKLGGGRWMNMFTPQLLLVAKRFRDYINENLQVEQEEYDVREVRRAFAIAS
jgi:hypothetical protein